MLAAADGTVLAAHGEVIGIAGANVAEYRALLFGLEHASSLGLDHVDARCDARLVVEQVTGHREPANPRLRELYDAIQAASQSIGTVIFTWVPAEANAVSTRSLPRRSALNAERDATAAPLRPERLCRHRHKLV